MRLFALVLGSRWFWTLFLVGGTVAAVELDRRGLAPWRQASNDEVVELPSVEVGDLGEAVAFEGSDEIPPGFDLTELPAAGDVGASTGVDHDARPEGPVAGNDAIDDAGSVSDGFGLDSGFDENSGFGNDSFDREFGSSDFGGRDLDEPSFDVDPLGDELAGGEFDPLRDEPFDPSLDDVGVERIDDRPLDPENGYELNLQRLDEHGVPVRPSGDTRPAAPRAAVLVLDVTAPIRLQQNGTATFAVVVRNDGNATARNVVLTARMDDGFALSTGTARAARKRMNELVPGETRKLNLDLRATATGRPCVQFAVAGDGLEGIEKRICVQVSTAASEPYYSYD